MSQVTAARSALATEVRRSKRTGSPDAATAVAQAKRRLVEANIAAYIERAVADAPPLTPEQRGRLAALLGGAK